MQFRFRNKKHRRPPITPQLFHPRLEPLEDRRLLAAAPLHVDIDSTAATPDGLTWETAYVSLQDALDQAATLNTDTDPENDIDQIWIAEGTYTPTALSDSDLNGWIDNDPRSATFALIDGVSLYGGFAGTETTLAERQPPIDGNFPHETILTGDLAGDDAVDIAVADLLDHATRRENAYSVVRAIDLTKPIALDSLTIAAGNGGYGGGIYNRAGTLAVTNATISANSANGGGGIYNGSGTLTITTSTISGNSAADYGGGFYNYTSGTLTVTNSTVSGNSAGSGGGFYNSGWFYNDYSGTLTVADSTISGNSAQRYGGGIDNRFGTLTVTNSIVALNEAPADPNISGLMQIGSEFNLIDLDPAFVRSPGPGIDAVWGTEDDDRGDYRLTDRSPAVNMGSNNLVPQGIDLDLDGNPRIFGQRTDIGAYEYQADPAPDREPPSTIVTTAGDAFDLYDGLVSLREAVWYRNEDEHTITFDGSLDGQEIVLGGAAIRLDHSITIDASDLGSLTIHGDGVSGVFVAHASEVELIRLTLTGGNASQGGAIANTGDLTVSHSTISGNSADDGGGIYNSSGTLEVTNSTISGNSSGRYGGGIYNGSGTSTVANSTISGNSANNGGGIGNVLGTLNVTSSTISGNSAKVAGGIDNRFGTLAAVNSIIALNDATSEPNIRGPIALGSGFNLIGIDPAFARSPGPGPDATWGTEDDDPGDLHLTDRSPAVNAGNNDSLPDGLLVDLDDNARIFGQRTDIGAYEYQADPLQERELPSTIVTTATDIFDLHDGLVSLREAAWYGAQDGSTVTFDGSFDGQQIVLAGTAIRLDHSVSVDASTLGSLTINGDGKSSVFVVHGAGVALTGLTITGGNAELGGGILNYGTLTVKNSIIRANTAMSEGGGILNDAGTLTTIDSTISENSGGDRGGGISSSGGSLTFNESTISANSAKYDGGIYSYSGSLAVTNSAILDNRAIRGAGGICRIDRGVNGSTFTVTNSRISGNLGHGILIQNTSPTSNSTISNATISDNSSSENGGGINVVGLGQLTVIDSTIADNYSSGAEGGGGIYNGRSTSTLINTTITGNRSAERGGGVYNSEGTLSVSNSTVSGNIAEFSSGGIHSTYGTLTVIDSTISHNVSSGDGGGIYNRQSTSTVINSALKNNLAEDDGGGIYNFGYSTALTVTNTTISGNSAVDDGGGVYHNGAMLTLISSTISGNSAGDDGGGARIRSGTATAYNTIVASNSAVGLGPDIYQNFTNTSSYNLIGDGSGMSGISDGVNGNLVGTSAEPIDPLLGPLGDYGGVTWTMPLLAGSPAIDAGDPAVVDPPLTDQHGGVRIVDGDGDGVARIDMGAFEYSPGETLLLDRRVFYGNSGLDGDEAIATDKVALRPGDLASFENYTSYDKGINGIVVDVAELADPDEVSAADFLFRVGNDNEPSGWVPVANAATVLVWQGEGVGGSDRVAISWPDYSIVNQWLQVTVKANERTGLVEDDVFYFGNAVGEAGDQPNNAIVNATDEIVARNFQHSAVDRALIDDPYDYNRDGLVNGTDQIIARENQTNPLTMLRLITPPVTEAEVVEQEATIADVDWLYQFDQTTAKRQRTERSAVEQAVDRLLTVGIE